MGIFVMLLSLGETVEMFKACCELCLVLGLIFFPGEVEVI